jgi:hypothetical protein
MTMYGNMPNNVAQNPCGKVATDRYWNAVYKAQAEEATEKKQRKPRKDKGVKRGARHVTDDSAEMPKDIESEEQDPLQQVIEMMLQYDF